ncbi:hypothetical protein ACROYT_G032963 [Oculina patagonica]
MKISHAKVLITFLLCIDATFPESIKITRFIPDRDPENWEDVVDSFDIPHSVCHDENRGYGNYCNTSSCEIQQEVAGSQGPYSCACPDKRATVTFLNNKWTCLGNKEARTQLGCQMNTLFDKEDKEDKLRTLKTMKRRKTKLKNREGNCNVNASSSWYIGCDGEMVPLERHTNRTMEIFRLQRDSVEKAYKVKVVQPTDIFLGRVINLGISCFMSKPPTSIKEVCLLFKLEGNFTCPVERSTGPIFSTALNPTTSSLEVKSKSTTLLRTATRLSISPTQAYSQKATVSATVSPTQAITQPSSGRKQKNEDRSSSSPLGIIAGVTVSITLVLLVVVAAIFIYRRRKSRKDAHKSTSEHTDKDWLGTSTWPPFVVLEHQYGHRDVT